LHRIARAAALLLPLLLASCVQPSAPKGAYRNLNAPISSIALFDLARLKGEWREVASFRPRGPCTICRATFTPVAGGVRLESGAGAALLQASGPGRMEPEGLTGRMNAPWWVLWHDADYRTLVLGTPSGQFGVILDRGAIGPDRLRAAKEILDWAGYDVAALKRADF